MRRTGEALLTLLGVALIAISASAQRTPPTPTIDGIVASEFVFETGPFASAHASTIVETTDGLVAAWFGGTREGAPDVGIWMSRRTGSTWTAPVEVATGAQPDGHRYPCWNPVLFQPRGQPLMLFYKVGPTPQTWWGMVRTSSDKGMTWSDARRLPDGILGPIKNKPVQLPDGTVLAPSSTESTESPSSWRVHFERTTDEGITWTSSSPRPSVDSNPIEAIQPSILIHPGGGLQAVGRTRAGRIFTTRSQDGGRTWTPISLTPLPNPNSGIDAVTLRDGRHLLVYNHTTHGRSPLNIALSRDGTTWERALVLESDPGEYSYPAVIQTADGLVHVTYTWRRQRIKHVTIDPNRLKPPAGPGLSSPAAQVRSSPRTLEIYVVDVEGGNATLFVTPSGESILIDSGNGGAAASRDADRITAAAKDAGVRQIDHLITTHYHGDHVGGLAELATRMPILHFVDHGPNVQPSEAVDAFLQGAYPALYAKARHSVAKPGERIATADLQWRIVASGGSTITAPLPGAGRRNPYCARFTPQRVNPVSGQPSGNTEDEQSVGSHVTFGRFRALHLGDLTWNKEFDLMCPDNRLGDVDLFIVSRHGQPSSNSEVLVHAIRPRVAVMNNGPRKGGQPDTMRILRSAPRLEDLWQLHFSVLSGQEYTTPGILIANTFDEPQAAMPIAPMVLPPSATGLPPAPQHNGLAYWIKVSAQADGGFSVTNSRNGFSRTYSVDRP